MGYKNYRLVENGQALPINPSKNAAIPTTNPLLQPSFLASPQLEPGLSPF